MGIADIAIVVIATNLEAIPFYERRGAVPFVTQFIQRVEPEQSGIPSTDDPGWLLRTGRHRRQLPGRVDTPDLARLNGAEERGPAEAGPLTGCQDWRRPGAGRSRIRASLPYAPAGAGLGSHAGGACGPPSVGTSDG